MKHQPKAGRDYDRYSDYVPFDSVMVIEKEKRPVLYDPSGKPLARPHRIGFDPNRNRR